MPPPLFFLPHLPPPSLAVLHGNATPQFAKDRMVPFNAEGPAVLIKEGKNDLAPCPVLAEAGQGLRSSHDDARIQLAAGDVLHGRQKPRRQPRPENGLQR